MTYAPLNPPLSASGICLGSDLQIVRDEQGIHIFDTPTGREIPMENSYVPPAMRSE